MFFFCTTNLILFSQVCLFQRGNGRSDFYMKQTKEIFSWRWFRRFYTEKSNTQNIHLEQKKVFYEFFSWKVHCVQQHFSSKRSYSTVLVYSKNSFWDVPALKMVSFVLARFPPKIFSCLKKRSLCKCQRATKFFWNTKCVLGNAFLFVSFSFLFWERSEFFFFSLPNFLHLSLQ